MDSVLSRSMFTQPLPPPSYDGSRMPDMRQLSSDQGPFPSGGIADVAAARPNPDDTAQQLMTMFQPRDGSNLTSGLDQQPIATFERGGLADRGYSEDSAPAETPPSRSMLDTLLRPQAGDFPERGRPESPRRLAMENPPEGDVRPNFGRPLDPRERENLEYDKLVKEEQQRQRLQRVPYFTRVGNAMGAGITLDSATQELAVAAEEEARKQNALKSILAAKGQGGDLSDLQNSLSNVPDRSIVPDVPLPPEKPASLSSKLSDIQRDRKQRDAEARRENAALALMNAGFAMASGKSQHALSNIGAGGMAGVQSFAEMEKARREQGSKEDILALHQAEMEAKTPLYKAQADYYAARPGIENQKIQDRREVAMFNAQKEASQEFIKQREKDALFAQKFSDKATGPALEKAWIAQKARELYPHQYRSLSVGQDSRSQGGIASLE